MCDERGLLKFQAEDVVYRIGSCAYASLEETRILPKPPNPLNLNNEKSVRRGIWVFDSASGVGFRPTWRVT